MAEPDPIREETQRLLIERLRAGLFTVLLLLPLFALLDLRLGHEHVLRLYAVKLIAAALIVTALYALRYAHTPERAVRVALLTLAALYAAAAASGIVSHDAATTPIICMVVAVIAAAMLPWGITAQLVNVTFAGLASLATVVAVNHGAPAAFGYPAAAVAVTLPISIYVTAHVQRHRLRLAERERERKSIQEQLDRFFVLSPDLLAIIGPDRRFRKMNPSWTRCLGWTEDELMARPWYEFVHPDDIPTALSLRGSADTRRFVSIENRYRHKDGGYRWLSWSASSLADGASYAVARDVTEAKHAEAMQRRLAEELQREAEVTGALARVGRELLSSLNAPVLLERLCRVTTEVLHCDASHTFIFEPEEQAYVAMAGYGDTPEQWESIRLSRFPRAAVGDVHERIEREGTVQVGPAAPLLPPGTLDAFGVTTVLIVALRREQQLIGVHSACYRGRTEPFSPQQERIAEGIAQLASFALENGRLVEELQRVGRFRSDFVAMMSHELRTPLNVIIGYQDLLAEGEFGALTPVQLEPLGRAQKSAGDLLDLINATLDLSRLEARDIPLTVEHIPLAKLLEDVAAEIPLPIDKTGLALVWTPPPPALSLSTDALKLKMVLKNVIGNALKFTDVGQVTVAARGWDGAVEFTVSDTGIGIPEETRPFIFEPFRQGDSSSTRRHGGVGLGLYIVRRLLDRLGGTISVDSELGHGSTFRITVPLCVDADSHPALLSAW
jgi:PAS domain S-box-containing protein